MPTVGFEDHDHSCCIADGVTAAESHCNKENLQLTPVRRRVLEILLEQHRAHRAYDILDQLREEGLGSQPPVVYRALEFLVGNGFAHKIEKANAFIACAHPGQRHTPAFLICRKCLAVSETLEPRVSLETTAQDSGFFIEHTVIEAEGLCPTCREGEAA